MSQPPAEFWCDAASVREEVGQAAQSARARAEDLGRGVEQPVGVALGFLLRDILQMLGEAGGPQGVDQQVEVGDQRAVRGWVERSGRTPGRV